MRTLLRASLLAGAVLAVGVAGLAFAQEISGVAFSDPEASLAEASSDNVEVAITEGSVRYIPSEMAVGESPAPARLEFELSARSGPVDVAIAQRATLGANAAGDLNRRGAGSELRVGRGLVRRGDGERDSVYMFVASDDEALTWAPGAEHSGVNLQDQVEVGDLSAGVTMERRGVRASLAYVEREASTRVGARSYSQDESFAGVTVTVKR